MTESSRLAEPDITGAPLSTADPRVQRSIDLVWREADLLDRKEYVAWNALYDEDGLYVIPIDREAQEFDDVLNMVYDDAHMRQARVTRMIEGYAIAAVDAAITVRTVSRFIPVEVSDEEVTLRAAQVLVAFKRGVHDLWAADVEYRVRLGDEAGGRDDRLVRKVVRLVDSDGAPPAAGFLL
ncbi:MAG: aromatic-ring-hydroxylating dioxygenase subunit beta [Aeromicrobium sp.]